jgi:DNA-binding protein H-NS
MDERKRDSIVAYLRRKMEEFGIDVEDVAKAIAQDQRCARYRSATGQTWSGEGEMPQWLTQAVSAGQSLEHFATNAASKLAVPAPSHKEWRDDPFAGTRLATIAPARGDAADGVSSV